MIHLLYTCFDEESDLLLFNKLIQNAPDFFVEDAQSYKQTRDKYYEAIEESV